MAKRDRASWLWAALAVAVMAGGCAAFEDDGDPPKQQGRGGAGGEECTPGGTDCVSQGGGGSGSEGCADKLKNGDETDVDCGGSACPACALGKECSGSDDCASGFCVEGVCCDGACDGPCDACTALLKESGDDGTCGPSTAGTPCGGEASCSEGVQVNGDTCDGAGECVTNEPTECGTYVCDAEGTLCLTECASNDDCAPCHACSAEGACEPAPPGGQGAGCDGDGQACDAAGECKAANGQACADAAECGSGSCVDGVCCDVACDGACQACDIEGSVGTCSTVALGTEEPTCAAPANICDSAGACKMGAAEACTADEECASGRCITVAANRVCAPIAQRD